MPEHILVTGGAGFIGSALINELNNAGYETSCVDHHDNHAVSERAYSVDLLKPGEFERVMNLSKPDRVIHLAAQVGRLRGEDDLRHTVRENAEMTTIIAAVCGERSPLVYCSTSEVYGDQGDLLLAEEDPMFLPHNLYGLSKRWGEEVCKLYAPWGLVIWRPSMPYGPGAPPGRGRRALDNMLWQAEHRKSITVHRGAVRSWCWLGDTVRGMRMTIDNARDPRLMSNITPQAYNIGRDDDPRTMLEIAHRACELAGAPESLIQVVDPPHQQTVVKYLSTQKIRSLGWEPTVELDEGMQKTYEWIKQFDAEGELVA